MIFHALFVIFLKSSKIWNWRLLQIICGIYGLRFMTSTNFIMWVNWAWKMFVFFTGPGLLSMIRSWYSLFHQVFPSAQQAPPVSQWERCTPMHPISAKQYLIIPGRLWKMTTPRAVWSCGGTRGALIQIRTLLFKRLWKLRRHHKESLYLVICIFYHYAVYCLSIYYW